MYPLKFGFLENIMTVKRIAIVALVIAVLALTGCVKREIVVNPTDIVPDVGIKSDIVIDWEQVLEDAEGILNEEDYPLGCYLDFAVHEPTDDSIGYTEIIWPCKNEMTGEEAIEYANALAKTVNDVIATQDFSYALSTDDSYGGYWDKNNMYVQVFRDQDILYPQQYYINQMVPAGTNHEIILQEDAQ